MLKKKGLYRPAWRDLCSCKTYARNSRGFVTNFLYKRHHANSNYYNLNDHKMEQDNTYIKLAIIIVAPKKHKTHGL